MEQQQARAKFDAAPDAAHVAVPTVAEVCGVSVATVWRWAKDGRLPKPRRLSPGTTRWNVGELRRHFASLGGAK